MAFVLGMAVGILVGIMGVVLWALLVGIKEERERENDDTPKG